MQKIEDILDLAVKRVKGGEQISAVVSNYPVEVRQALASHLNLIQLALTLPKKTAPEAKMRKLYLETKPQPKFSIIPEWLNIYAVAFTVLMLFVAGTSYAAFRSGPGDLLFSLKRSVEIARLKLATNPEDQARLQLTFANSRLEEAENIIAQNNSNQTGVAITELNKQTEAALNNIQQIAVNNPGVKQDKNLITSVKSLADNQAKLLTKVSQADPKDTQIAASTQKTVENIQQLIAASNDQGSTNLPVNPVLNIAGNITALDIKNSSITIDKNTFTMNVNDVQVHNQDGNNILLSSLGIGDDVQIHGVVRDNKNVAESINLISKAIMIPQDNTLPNTIKPQDTFGGFILESPADLPASK